MGNKILFVIPNFGDGGAQKQCALLYSWLSNIDCNKYCLVYVGDGPNTKWLTSSNKVFQINSSSLYNPKVVHEISKIIKNEKIMTIFSWLPTADIYSGIIKIFNPKIKWIIAERDSFYKSSKKTLLRNKLALLVDEVIANSEKGAGYWISDRKFKNKISIVNNIYFGDIVDSLEVLERKKYVGYIGRMEEQKNSLLTAKIFCGISNKVENKIYMAGNGSQINDIKKITEIKECENIDIKGYVDNAFDLLKRTKVFVTLSRHEGTPNALIEAIAASCLIVATKIPEHVKILGEDYKFYVNVGDNEEKISCTILRAINVNYKEINSYINFGKRYINEMNIDFIGKKYQDLLGAL